MMETMDALSAYLDDIDQITRAAHGRYRAYRPEDLIELSPALKLPAPMTIWLPMRIDGSSDAMGCGRLRYAG
jgi:hypothetical protein